MFVNGSGRNEQSYQRTFNRCFLPSFGSFDQTVSEEKNLKNQPIRNKNCLWRPCLYMDRDEISTLYRETPIDASYQVSVQPSGFTGEELKNQPIRNKSRLWRPFLLTDRNEMGNLFRSLSIDASYQVSARLAKRFQRRRFLKICIEINAF